MSDLSTNLIQTSFGNEALDDPLIFASQQSFSGGEDSFIRPTLLRPDQCQHLLNVLVRDNYEARTRPGADAIPSANAKVQGNWVTTLTFLSGAQNGITCGSNSGFAVGSVVSGTGIPNGTTVAAKGVGTIDLSAATTADSAGVYTFTVTSYTPATAIYSARYFDTPTYQQLLVSAAAGATPKFFKYEGSAWTDLSGLYAPGSSDSRLAMAQGVDKVLIADGSANPLQIYDGSTFTSAGAAGNTNAPIGATILCWHTSRMFASGIAARPDEIDVSNFLTFAAGQWNLTTRSFRVGAGDGDPIVSLASMQSFMLAVLKRNSIWLINTDPSKDAGTIYEFAAIQLISSGIGCVGRDAWCSYENDILFMAQDGIRSVQRMQAAAGQWQLSTPLSQPIQPIIDRINRAAWDKICAIKHNELAVFFVPLDASTTNNYVLAWNGRLNCWMGAWDHWTGLCVEQTRFSGVVRLVFGDSTGLVNQWKDNLATNGIQDDATYTDNGVGYKTQAWLPSWQFGEINCDKTGHFIRVKFSGGNAAINFSWVSDGATVQTWVGAFQPSGDILGTDVLPFLLASNQPTNLPQPIRGLPTFNEAYLKIESQNGWWFLKSVTAGAFINPFSET